MNKFIFIMIFNYSEEIKAINKYIPMAQYSNIEEGTFQRIL